MFDFFANHTVLEGDYRIQDIKVDDQLGRGNAHVYTATIKGQNFALKQIEIKNDYEYQNFLKEISNMQEISLKSEWIVKYNGYLVTKMERNQYDIKKYAYIVMQCAEENLQQFLNQRRDFKYRLKVNELVAIIDQILAALASLQEIHRAHCDIKPENILIMNSKTYAIKLCDVGSSKVVSKQSFEEATILGTVPFLAPELLKVQGSKVIGNKAFKSDVFSFGLVVLYLITQKKFKSQQRLQIDQQTYRQVIGEWIKYAKQLCDDQSSLSQILKGALQFDQFRRPMFKDLKFTYFNERKKKAILNKSFVERLQKEQELKQSRMQQTSTYFSSQPSNQINLFKTRRVERINFTKTISNGANFKISKAKNSPSPVKRTNSLASNSPQKTEKSVGIGSMHDLLSEMKKVIYIGQQTKNYLPQVIENQQEKHFILGIPQVRFRKAQTITVLPSCTYDVFEAIEQVQSKRLYLQTMEKEVLGVPLDAPILKFSKIRINLNRCQMIGGFDGLFRIITGTQLQLLELRLSDTQASTKEITYLLDRLLQCPKLQTLLLSFERKLITEEQHQMVTQKLAKMPLKKLSLLMNECYIQYQKPARWLLPKTVQTLYLDYGNNLLQSVLDNLSLSLSNSKQLKQIAISLQNNALNKKDVNALIKAVAGLDNLQRVTLNLAYNKVEEIKYLQSTLSLLKGINYLEVKLHKTEIDTEKILQLIDYLKEQLFVINFSLKMMKITCNRNKSLHLMRQHLNKICTIQGQNKTKSLRCQVVGFDNLYYMIYIKKNDKLHSNRAKGGAAVKKSPKLQIIPKMSTMSQGITLSNFNSAAKPSNICYQLYTSSDSFNNYLCLTCCQSKQINKNMYYCKFCVSNCLTESKDHYFVKVAQATRCVCAYSGQCKSDTKAVVCSDKMGAPFKKQYQCFRCEASYCMVCIQLCKDTHREWIRQCKQLSFFKCRSKITIKQ